MRYIQSFPIRGSRRLTSVWRVVAPLAAVLASVLPIPATVRAASPAGMISCSVVSDASLTRPTGILFHPFINAVPRTVRLATTRITGACDASGVTGGKAPIIGVAFRLAARLSNSTCAGLTSAPQLDKGRITIKWQGLNQTGHPMTVALTRARLANSSYNTSSHALVLVTQPITRGAFVGATVTLHLGFEDYVAAFEEGCSDGGGFVDMAFGHFNPSILDVQ